MLSKAIKEHWLFLAILLASALLRLIPLFGYQLTLDELSGLSRTRFDSFGELIDKGVKIDAHPAFVQVLIYYTTRLFGYVNWIIKLPFLLMSLGTVCYGYFFGLRNFSKQAGIFAALIFAFSLIFVFYSPIARMYGCGPFFSMALLYYFFEIVFNGNTKRSNYILLALFALLSAYNHHMGALFALILCASGLLFLKPSYIKMYLLTCTAVVICYLPNMPVTLYQLGIGGIGFEQDGWLPVPEVNTILTFIKILLGTGAIYLIFLSLIILSIALHPGFKFGKKRSLLLIIFLLNYLIIYFYSVYRAPVYQHSVMLFSAVAFVMLAVSFLEYNNKRVFYLAAGLLSCAFLYRTYLGKDFLRQSVKTVFEYQFERTFYYKKMYGDKNVYPVFFDADDFMKDVYFQKYKGIFDCKISSDPETHSLKLLSELLAGLKSDYIALASSVPEQQALVKEFYPYLLENTQTQGINFKLYSRRPDDRLKAVEDDRVILSSTVFKNGDFIYGKTEHLEKKNNTMSFPVDSLNEFPFDARAKYSHVVSAEGQMLLVKTRAKLKRLEPVVMETAISVYDERTNAIINYDAKSASDFIIKPDSTVTTYVNIFFGTKHAATDWDAPLTVYIWNKGKENFVLKDFEIRLIDYCPRKWQLWD
jgi:hypothetical protein